MLDFLPVAADLPPRTWLVLTSRLRQTRTHFLKGVTVHFVSRFEDVAARLFGKAPAS